MRIAIDGPAGAGKSTVARAVAERLGATYIDTGAMYRAAALACLRAGVKLEDAPAVERVVRECSIELVAGPGGRPVVTLDGEDVSDAIRRADVTALSSPVSALPGVRRILVAKQQALASDRDVVMEGRDIGTVVLPDAEVKVFLTATIEERARRRAGELASRGESADASAIAAGIAERDARDSSRAESPLCQAPGCTVIVSDDMGIAEVVERVVALTRGVARTRRNSRR